MIENARGQLFLVLLSLLAGIACTIFLKIPLGHDLRGGTQLRYEVPRDLIDQEAKRGQVLTVDQMMEQAIQVITDRIDPTGVLDPLITRSGDTGILIELPWFENRQDLDDVLARIANLGKLEMRIVAEDKWTKGDVAFNLPAEKQRLEAWLKNPEKAALIKENYQNIRQFNEDIGNGPLAGSNLAWYPRLIRQEPKTKEQNRWDRSFTTFDKLGGSVVKGYDDAEWNGGTIPEAVLKKEKDKQFLVEFVALNMKERFFTGEQLDPAAVGPGQHDGRMGVNYQFLPGPSADYAEWSDEYTGKCSAIVLNGVVKSAPSFTTRISGTGIITGDFTESEVDELVKVLKTGSLRVEPTLVSKESIGPTLGMEAIKRGAWSLAAGTLLVFAFMLTYYRVAGTVACITLVLNVFLLWASMLFMQATITLPGLGGIVLTMGMAVDANVLIYERIREELAKGKELLQSVRAGFDRAMSAILDSNITTFLVGMVLYNVGVGPVRGFAVTLMVGIVTTVFTQFFVTRLLFHYALEKNWLVNYKPRSLWANLNLDYVRLIKPCVTMSAIGIGVGLVVALFVVPRETLLGIDFTGGANLRMALAQPMTDKAVRERLRSDTDFARDYPNVQVNRYGDENADGTAEEFNLRIKLTDTQRARIETERLADRAAHKASEAANQEPPKAYEPPYVVALRRLFQEQLVKPAFSQPQMTPHISNQNQQYAQVEVSLQQPIDLAKVREKLQKGLSQCQVDALADANATQAKELRVQWVTQSTVKPWQVPGIVKTELTGLKDIHDKAITLSEPFPDANEIQGRLVGELRNAAIGALLLAWGLIVLYLRVRFHEYKYGIAAVVALIHDVLVAFVAVAICNWLGFVDAEINLAMIACFLTIIGYSVNDTIVIFDRIRENAQENARLGVDEPFRNLINRALNQTMSRTLLTSGLTLLVVIAQFLVNWGSDSDLESFAFAMIIGMVSGVYSTIYIAAPVLIWLDKGDLSKPKVEPLPAEAEAGAEAPAS